MNHSDHVHTPFLHQHERTLAHMQRRVREVNHQNGWFDTDRRFAEGMALLHSEVSEALEAFRTSGTKDMTGKCLNDEHNHRVEPCVFKPEGVGSEFADILVRLLDECERWGIDLEREFWRKLEYNETRGYRHGGKAL